VRHVVILGLLVAAPAWAQSKRYPPNPVDKEREAEAQSKTWDQAINPSRADYEAHLKLADTRMAARTPDAWQDAVKELDQAVALLPREAAAYRRRGEAYLQLKEWAKCAADLQAADERTPRIDNATAQTIRERRDLGVCQARAGHLAEAERTLAAAAATGSRDAELWTRLGETRIAMGKLDEAQTALRAALEMSDGNGQTTIHWLLAGLYDRARQPSEAENEVKEAAQRDPSYNQLQNPTLPFIGAGEGEYLFGLAYTVDIDQLHPRRPESALVYFKQFLKLAPQSPWRRRAEEHVRDLKSIPLPEVIERRGGCTASDAFLDAARPAIRKAMPAMRACLAKMPNLILEVSITRVGPRSSDPRERPRFIPPAAGITTTPVLGRDSTSRIDFDLAVRCVEQIADHIQLPTIKEPDLFCRPTFRVAAP
jgi:tetratricopeptide (TPR) repeat protein